LAPFFLGAVSGREAVVVTARRPARSGIARGAFDVPACSGAHATGLHARCTRRRLRLRTIHG